MLRKFPNYIQQDQMDCGATCLQIIAKHFGKSIPIHELREFTQTNRLGTSLKGISHAAEKIGLKSLPLQVTVDQLVEEVPLPCIIHWNRKHFVVLYAIKKGMFYVSDPGYGLINYTRKEFEDKFINTGNARNGLGFILLLDTTPSFFEKEYTDKKFRVIHFLKKYLLQYKRYITQLMIGLFITSILNLIFPFLTQAIVDIGIQNQDVGFIYLILLTQLMLFFGKSGIEIIKSWLLLHITQRINISILTDFFRKLMKLPISFFDVKMVGDLFQRISDHQRVENFIANTSINTIFSSISLIIFGIVLGIYNPLILAMFLLFSAIYVLWILAFMRKRQELDYKSFNEQSDNQSKIFELITGMQEIKLHNAELSKRWEWERIQTRLFKINLKRLSLDQIQSVGAQFINEFKNILISFYTAKLVIDGELTLGMMLSVSYIIGQLNIPLQQLIEFLKAGQSAKIGMERLSEIQKMNEEDDNLISPGNDVDLNQDISFKNVSFRYNALSENLLFNDLSFTIPHGKTTAIVGLSGSGKTTLLKLLLKFYKPEKGTIAVGEADLQSIPTPAWRETCGVVMQEGYIFPDSVSKNIALGEESIDYAKLKYALKMANIDKYVNSLPQGYHTVIGKSGHTMSTGQKQRILIARAIYKDPKFVFFDEATSALDAENEKIIVTNLTEFLKGRTVVIIAHRLSTVKDADQIIVVESGKILERGNHQKLVAAGGAYYQLIKNQLELGL